MTRVRAPADDDERQKIARAVEAGAGVSIQDFIEKVVGESVDKEFIEAIHEMLNNATELDQEIEIEKEIQLLWKWRQEMA